MVVAAAAVAAAAPRASRDRYVPGVLCTPGITAVAAAPGVVITVMPRVGPTSPMHGLPYALHEMKKRSSTGEVVLRDSLR